jgi:hypothetical protein
MPSRLTVGFLFALVGGLATLLASPVTRDFYTRLFLPSAADRALKSAKELSRGNPLPAPETLRARGLWLAIAAKRLANGRPLHPSELAALRQIAADGAHAEPDNGYWYQAGAAFALDAGDMKAATEDWLRSARALRWDTYETALLSEPFIGLPVPASVYADLYDLRNDSVVRHIGLTARRLLAAYWTDPSQGIALRAATVLNGDLIRSHAHSLPDMNGAIAIVDLALVRPDGPRPNGHHQLLVSRIELEREFDSARLDFAGKKLEHAFDECDSAAALTSREDAAGRRRSLSLTAVLAETLPGATLLSVVGAVVVLVVGLAMRLVAMLDQRLAWSGTLVAAVLLLFLGLREVPYLVALTVALSVVFCGSTPTNVRRARPRTLGRLHDVFIALTALLFVGSLTALFCFVTLVSSARLGALLPLEFDLRSAGAGLIALILAGIILTAPLWAFAQRLPTHYVLNLAFQRLAKFVAVLSFSVAVILGPVALIVERSVEPQLQRIFSNEPVYYLIR